MASAEKRFINGKGSMKLTVSLHSNGKLCPKNHKLRIPKAIEEKIVYLRTSYHFGPDMIVWLLKRYHDIKVSRNGCYNVLVRNKLNRLPENIKVGSRSKFKL
ncbi:MAG: hypothetical protein L3J46_10340 [Kangiellaceae bacterium]|nr:hypothetical protein [Kangiellaceae bacterium]